MNTNIDQNRLLDIKNLSVTIENKTIIENFNLSINKGEVHAIMGPNGSGKSTLAKVLARHPDYTVTNGSITFENQNLLEYDPVQSANHGIFLSLQYPVAIPGVSNIQFLKSALNAKLKFSNKNSVDSIDFLQMVKKYMVQLNMSEELLSRSINDGFSGGEKKRNEILQMLLLQPKLAILDETDSGLDIDALKTVAKGVNSLRSPNKSIILITHYQRLLDYITPDFVHVVTDGKIIHSGDKSLPLELEEKGYAWLNE